MKCGVSNVFFSSLLSKNPMSIYEKKTSTSCVFHKKLWNTKAAQMVCAPFRTVTLVNCTDEENIAKHRVVSCSSIGPVLGIVGPGFQSPVERFSVVPSSS